MFKAILRNEKANKEWIGHDKNGEPFPTREEAEAWLKRQIGKPERLPEREVEFKEDLPQEDIKEIKEVVIDTDGEKPIIKKIAVLKQEFVVEIINLNEDVEYLTNKAIENRRKEYPSQEELNEALYLFFDKDESKILEVLGKRKAVDSKYPLPEKQEKVKISNR